MMQETVIAFAAIVIFSTIGAASAQIKILEVDISKMEPGLPPPDFESRRTGQGDAGNWIVIQDASAANGRALAQTSTDRTDDRFPLAIFKPFSGKDVEVAIRFKPVSGTVDQAGGIAVRLAAPDDYYVVRANALEDNVRFYRVVKGRREQLAGANVKVASGRWHTLSLRAEGERFTVSFDGRRLFTADDKTFAGAGKIALWTKSDSVTYFDKITIWELP